MRRTFVVLLGALLMTVAADAQERERVFSDEHERLIALLKRIAATQPEVRTFRFNDEVYYVERRRDTGKYEVSYQLVDLYGNDVSDEVKYAYVTRSLDAPLVQGAMGSTPVGDPYEEGIVRGWSVHWVPLGASRSYSEPAGKGKQSYMPFALAATVFSHRMDGGRLFLFGAGAGFAVGNSNPDSNWTGTLHITFVPVSVRVWDRWQVAPTFGTAEISGRSLLRWKGFKTAGVQVSVCLSNCGD